MSGKFTKQISAHEYHAERLDVLKAAVGAMSELGIEDRNAYDIVTVAKFLAGDDLVYGESE